MMTLAKCLPRVQPILLLCAILAGARPAGAAATRIFSYDPANAETRLAAGPVTIEFLQGLLSTKVLRVFSTQGEATAVLKPAGEASLGAGGLAPLIGRDAPERALYAVLDAQEGPALVAALCPGSTHGWMSFGRIKADQPLRVVVLGRPDAGPAHLCRRLDFTFHGEWRAPPGRAFDPGQFEHPTYPR